MNRGLWISRKNYLFTLIKKVSDAYGGDTEEELLRHSKQVLDMYPDNAIEEAIICYQEMIKELD